MTKIYVIFSVLVLCVSLLEQTPLHARNFTDKVAFVDDEYDKFRKEGDAFFKQGDYKKALNKFLSCLEVPGFSNDEYAKTQADLCQKAVKLGEEADAALSKKNNKKALGHLEELLMLNPNDAAAKKKLGSIWLTFGEEKFEKALYKEAISDLKRALTYGPDKKAEQLIKTAIMKLAENDIATPKKSPALKIAVGVLGVGAGLYALKLNSDWKTKLSAVDKAQQSGDYASYQTAYNDAAQFQSSQSLRNICVGVAAAALAAEVFLLVRKPKITQPKISLSPASSSVGLALNYRF
jgi:tetratricopeptide (TPR) repeat protein